MNNIAILMADQPQCKRFSLSNTNEIIKTTQADAFWFNYTSIEISSINELHLLLTELENEPERIIIRGKLLPDIDPEKPVLRRIHPSSDYPAYFTENPDGVSWICVDMDKVPVPDEYNSDNLSRIGYLISLLPTELHDVSFHYQWSNSAGVFGWDTLSCHLWFWLSSPVTDTDIRTWASWHDVIDSAALRTVQPHFTANPIFDSGVSDPLGDSRSGLITLSRDAADLSIPKSEYVDPVISEYRAANPGNYSIPLDVQLEKIGPNYHEPIISICASQARLFGSRLDQRLLKDRIRERIAVAPPGANPKSNYLDDKYLNSAISSAMRKYGNHTPTNWEIFRRTGGKK